MIQKRIFVFIFMGLLLAKPGAASELKVLTLNTWLLSVAGFPIGKDQKLRLKLMPDAMAATGADVILLQEAWKNKHRKIIRREMQKRGYPYSFFVYRKLSLGDGLMVVSRYPIIRTEISKTFSQQTQVFERLANKRVLYAEIELPSGERVDFVTTHLGALGYSRKNGTYKQAERGRQRTQFVELRQFIERVKTNKRFIFAGDINSDYRELMHGMFQPHFDPVYSNFIQGACGNGEDFVDTFLAANHMTAESLADPTYSRENPYVRTSEYFSDSPSEMEDFIFSCGFGVGELVKSQTLFKEALREKGLFVELKTGMPKRLSDHYGLMTTFQL